MVNFWWNVELSVVRITCSRRPFDVTITRGFGTLPNTLGKHSFHIFNLPRLLRLSSKFPIWSFLSPIHPWNGSKSTPTIPVIKHKTWVKTYILGLSLFRTTFKLGMYTFLGFFSLSDRSLGNFNEGSLAPQLIPRRPSHLINFFISSKEGPLFSISNVKI